MLEILNTLQGAIPYIAPFVGFGAVYLYRFEPPLKVGKDPTSLKPLTTALTNTQPEELPPGVHDVSIDHIQTTALITVHDDGQGDTYGELVVIQGVERTVTSLPNTGNGHAQLIAEPIPGDSKHVLLYSLIKSQPKQT
mgnify:CR=1 FL=1